MSSRTEGQMFGSSEARMQGSAQARANGSAEVVEMGSAEGLAIGVGQFYFTSCPANMKHGPGATDFDVRAATQGMEQTSLDLAKYAYYVFNPVDPRNPKGEPPIRLAWVTTPKGRLLVHSVRLARDPFGRVGGNYFSHALFGPEMERKTLEEVAASWGSAGWTRDYPADGSINLQMREGVPLGGELSPAEATRFVNESHNRALFEFVLSAWLDRPQKRQAFVVADPRAVALAVWCLARALPQALSRPFTFSTFEGKPLNAPPWLVGAWGDGGPCELPQNCALSPNCAWPPKGAALASHPYAVWAAEKLATGQIDVLDRFMEKCNRCDSTERPLEVGMFLDLWQFEGGQRNADLVARLLAQEQPARHFVGHPDVLQGIISEVISDRRFNDVVGASLNAAAHNGWIAQAEMYRRGNAVAVEAAKLGDLQRLMLAANVVKGHETFADELASCSPREFKSDVRNWLRPWILKCKSRAHFGQIDAWLEVEATQLGCLHGLSEADQITGFVACLRKEALPHLEAEYLASQPGILAGVYRSLNASTTRLGDDSAEVKLSRAFAKADLALLCQEFANSEYLPRSVVARVIPQDEVLRQQNILTRPDVQALLTKDDTARRDALAKAVRGGWVEQFVVARPPGSDIGDDLCKVCIRFLCADDRKHAQIVLNLVDQRNLRVWEAAFATAIGNMSDSTALALIKVFPSLAAPWLRNTHRSAANERLTMILSGEATGSMQREATTLLSPKISFWNEQLLRLLVLRPELAAIALVSSYCSVQEAKTAGEQPRSLETLYHGLFLVATPKGSRPPTLAPMFSCLEREVADAAKTQPHQGSPWKLLDIVLGFELNYTQGMVPEWIHKLGNPLLNNNQHQGEALQRLAGRSLVEFLKQRSRKPDVWQDRGVNVASQLRMFLTSYLNAQQDEPKSNPILALVSLALVTRHDLPLLNAAVEGLRYFEEQDQKILRVEVFKPLLSLHTYNNAKDAYESIKQLGEVLQPEGGLAAWAAETLAAQLQDRANDPHLPNTRRLLAALVRICLTEQHPTPSSRTSGKSSGWMSWICSWVMPEQMDSQVSKELTARKTAKLILARPNSREIFDAILRCTDNWPEELVLLWRNVARKPRSRWIFWL